jgi:hypothetical protein
MEITLPPEEPSIHDHESRLRVLEAIVALLKEGSGELKKEFAELRIYVQQIGDKFVWSIVGATFVMIVAQIIFHAVGWSR